MSVAEKVAIVAGGASGLGAATTRKLAADGAKVVVVDANASLAKAVALEVDGVALECDVRDAAQVKRAVDEAKKLGPIRIAVNCAGIATPAKILGKDGPHDLDLFRRVIEINLIGTFNVLRCVAAAMAENAVLADNERGVIINTASVAAFDGQIGQAAYASSKGGVTALTLPAARELARYGIRVVTIAPGLFLTPLLMGLPPEAQTSLAAAVPFPSRLGDPAEYAELVAHIWRNRMLNGEVIRLDGALRMAPK